VMALVLALKVSTDELAHKAAEIAESLAERLTPLQVDEAKRVALSK